MEKSELNLLSQIRELLTRDGNGRVCVGYQKLSVDNSGVLKLTVPALAQSAEITLESAGSTNASLAARYTIDNSTDPETSTGNKNGVPIGDFDTIEILGNTNLTAFRVIAVDNANTKYLKIHYFA